MRPQKISKIRPHRLKIQNPNFRILSAILLIMLAGMAGYWYAFMRTHQNMLKLKPAYTAVLFNEYTEDEAAANSTRTSGQLMHNSVSSSRQGGACKESPVFFHDHIFKQILSIYIDCVND